MGRVKKFSAEEMFDSTEQLLLTVGYEGFTMGLVAEQLMVSRAAIYKYYTNKEALIADFMLERMNAFMRDIKNIPLQQSFEQQVDHLLTIIFQTKDLHQVLRFAHLMNDRGDEEIRKKLLQLGKLHQVMYEPMQTMIEKGKSEGVLKPHIPDALILGFIFQSIAIRNPAQIEESVFVKCVKEMIFSGIYQQ